MKLLLAVAAFGLCAASSFPSMAQTATCYRLGNVASCTSSPTLGDNPAQQRYSGFQEVARLRDKNEDRDAMRQDQGLREDVGALVADGRCADARKVALRAGDFALADKAGSMCTPARKR